MTETVRPPLPVEPRRDSAPVDRLGEDGEAAVAPISVIVRSKNHAGVVGETLDMLFRQTRRDFEVLSVDNDSSDGTPAVLDRFPCRRFTVSSDGYVAGAVLNWMARAARGELLVFLNSDSTPADESWLDKLVAPLSDPRVAAAYGRQLPRPEAYPWVARDHDVAYPADARRELPDFFSLANAAVRRAVWAELPFDEHLISSEDHEWARRARRAGWSLVYVPEAAVFHSHNYTLSQLRRRFFTEGWADSVIYAGAPSPQLGFGRLVLVRTMTDILKDVAFCARRGAWRSMPVAPLWRTVQNVSRWRGVRHARAGRSTRPYGGA